MAEESASAVVTVNSVTISPIDYWQVGTQRSLTVTVEDIAGNETSVEFEFTVRLSLK